MHEQLHSVNIRPGGCAADERRWRLPVLRDMISLMLRKIILAMMLLLAGCAATSSKEGAVNLWLRWQKIDTLLQTDYPDAPPIILIHGWNGGEFTWPEPERLVALERRLGRDIFFFTYRTGLLPNRFPPLEILEEQLERYLSQFETVEVIAHSMGGLLLRQYLSHHSEHPVRRIVFLSVPHFGTNTAQLLLGVASISPSGNMQAEEIQPGSDFLWQLNSLQGAELEGIEVLNVYVSGESLAESDFVVDAASAYLPWGHNVAVEGGHHTLAEHLDRFEFIINYLTDGTVPEEASMPARRDLWLRFAKPDGSLYRFTPSAFKHLNTRGMPRSGMFSICCERPTGLYAPPASTVVIEDIQPGDRLQLLLRDGTPPLEISADDYISHDKPVEMRVVSVPQPRGMP